MSLRLCIDCGCARTDPRLGCCPECGAEAPAWEAAPITFEGFVHRTGRAAALLVAIVACVGVIVLMFRWPDTSGSSGLARFGASLILAIGAAVSGRALSFELFHRDHVHDDGHRRGKARTLFGRIVSGEGQAIRIGERYLPATPSLQACPVFTGMRSVHPQIAQALRMSQQPKAVDVALLAALLGLAARGRCELVLSVHRRWEKPRSGGLTRRAEVRSVLARAISHDTVDDGWLETALLTTLDTLSRTVPEAPAGAGLGPYRAGGARSDEEASGSLISVPILVAALTGGNPRPRGWLQGNLRSESRRAGRTEVAVDQAAHLGAELARELRRGSDAPAAALLVQIRAGLSDKRA